MPHDYPAPRREYTARLAARRSTGAQLAQRDTWIANLRLVVFLCGATLASLALAGPGISAWYIAFPAVGFGALLVAHERVLSAKSRADAAAAYYEQGLARLDGRWAGTGVTDTAFAPENHPYAADLDLFGEGSLFDLLCTARTRGGQHTLALWLCEPAAADVVRARQQAVDELRGNVDLRERLALLGAQVRSGVHPRTLTAWGDGATVPLRGALRIVATLLSVLAYATAVGYFVHPAFFVAFVFVAGIQMIFRRVVRPRVQGIVDALETPRRELETLGAVLAELEQESFTDPHLRALQGRFAVDGVPASACLRRLERLAVWLDARLNQMFAPFALFLLWDFQLAAAIERWRARHGASVGRWLDAVGELEALCALAAYAFEHPADPYPEIVESGPVFDATGLGHPLLPEDESVRNDVRLAEAPAVLLVSGSNMSGKSTLLRTVGTNTVLALAGAPVRASRLRLSPLAIGASIRMMDSLQAGTSRFYAEIKRLHDVMNLTAGPRPVLFLLDELLHGTNSHDRRLGAAAVVRGLLEAGAIGLITTHDLALTEMASALGSRAANVHFADDLVDDALHFDYRLKPGVVQHSNALALMRAVGLKV